MHRRTLLNGIGTTAIVAGAAGCLGGDDDADDTAGDGGGDDDSEETQSVSIESQDVSTLGHREIDEDEEEKEGERYVDSEADVTFGEESVTVTGELEAASPCYEAVIADVDLEDGLLTVTVELEDPGEQSCAMVVTEVEYEATIATADGVPETVVVVHGDRVGDYTAAEIDS